MCQRHIATQHNSTTQKNQHANCVVATPATKYSSLHSYPNMFLGMITLRRGLTRPPSCCNRATPRNTRMRIQFHQCALSCINKHTAFWLLPPVAWQAPPLPLASKLPAGCGLGRPPSRSFLYVDGWGCISQTEANAAALRGSTVAASAGTHTSTAPALALLNTPVASAAGGTLQQTRCQPPAIRGR